jgi:hypothetical protein
MRALERHGIPTIGTGRRARLEPADLETLKAKERAVSAARLPPPEPPKDVALARINSSSMDAREKQFWRRHIGQLHRRKPTPK